MILKKTFKLSSPLILTLFPFLFGNFCSAAPIVNGFSGTISHGETVTLTGEGFGTKAHAGPLRWDTFDDGTVGKGVETSGYWTNGSAYQGFSFSTDGLRSSLAGKNIKVTAERGVKIGLAYKQVPEFTTEKKKLIGFWTRVDPVNLPSGQCKIADLEADISHASPPGIREHVVWSPDNSDPSKSRNHYFTYRLYGADTSVYYNNDAPYYWGKWQYNLIEFEESDPNTANGKFYFSKSTTSSTLGAIVKKSVLNQTTTDGSAKAHWVKLRAIMESGPGNESATVYYDDVYIDDSWQRVEIGDNPVYANCTHREMQIPLSWETQKIQFKFNQGSFSNGETVYVFVVDNNGVPNDRGVAVTIGNSSSSTAPVSPSAPHNLRIVSN